MLFIALVLGFALGSFLNVVVIRLHNKQKGIIAGRSECPKCHALLNAKDLIPVFSFIFLKGKCRYCKSKIDPQYLIVELINGFLLTFITFYLLPTLQLDLLLNLLWPFLFYTTVIEILFLIALYDFRYTEIPNSFSFPLIFFLLISTSFAFTIPLLDSILGAFTIFIFFYLQILIPYLLFSIKKRNMKYMAPVLVLPAWFFIQIISIQNWFNEEDEAEIKIPKGLKEWIGFGDLRIAFIMGLLLGFKFGLIALFISYLIGATFGIVMLIRKKTKKPNVLPFGPFLAFSTFITLFYGHKFLDLYFQFGEMLRNFVL